jgi:hypothetical protein
MERRNETKYRQNILWHKESAMQSSLDQELGNDRLQCLLGSGGFADVSLGEHMQLGTQAAIKVHRAHLTRDHRY